MYCALILLVLCLAGMRGRAEAPASAVADLPSPQNHPAAPGPGGWEQAEAGAVLWHYADENRFAGSPAVDVEGRFYIGNDAGILFCFSSEGAKLWEFDAGALWEGVESLVMGTPVIAPDGTIYAGAAQMFLSEEYPKHEGWIGSLYALNRDGTLRWEFGESGVATAPAVDANGRIYFGTVNNQFVALNPDGTVHWEVEMGGRWTRILSSAAVDGGGNLFFENLVHLNSEGSLIWRHNWFETISSPALGLDGMIYGARHTTPPGIPEKLIAFRRDSSIQWQFEAGGGIRSSPVLGVDGTVYFGSDDGWFYAVDQDGGLQWKFETGGPVGGSAAVDREGNIYFGSHDGKLYGLAADGTANWDLELGKRVRGSPAIGPDGRIYIAADEGGIYMIKGQAGLAESPWPMIHQNPAHTGLSPVALRKPDAPRNLAASEGSLMGVVRVTWSATPWASSYELWRNTKEDLSGAEVMAAELIGPSEFNDDRAVSGQIYYYWVRAKNGLGESEFSAAATGHHHIDVREVELAGALSWISAPAIGQDGSLYLNVNGPGRRIMALDAEGEMIWEYPISVAATITDIVAGGDGTIYFGADKTLFAVDRTGTLKWEFTVGNRIVNAPAVTLDQGILVASLDGNLYAVDWNGSELWRQKVSCNESSIPVVGPNGNIHLVTAGIMTLSPNGNLLWSSKPFPQVRTGLAVGEEGTIYAGADPNFIQAWNSDGTLKWELNVRARLMGTPLVGGDGTIYCATAQRVLALHPDGTLLKEYLPGWEGWVRSPLILGSDGSLFFATTLGYLVKLDGDFQFQGYYSMGENLLPRNQLSPMMLGPGGSLYFGANEGKLIILKGQISLPETGWPSSRRDSRQSGSAAEPAPVPSTPAGFEAAAGTPWVGLVRLKWSDPVTFARFQIWRSTVPELAGASLVAELSGPSLYDDRSAEPGVTYYYWIQAFNAAGESGFAGPITGGATPGTRLLWEIELPNKLRVPVVGLDGTIYVDDYDNVLHAMEPSSGKVIWTYSGVIGSPAIHGNGLLICRTGEGLVALDSEGNVKWKHQTEKEEFPPGDTWPAIAKGGAIYWGRGEVLHAFSPEGEPLWKHSAPSEIHISPSIGPDGTIYIGTSFDPHLYAIGPDGLLKWAYSFEHETGTAPAFGEDGTIYIGSYDQHYYALNPDGTLQWKELLGWGHSGYPSISPRGDLLFPVNTSHLHVLRPDGTARWDFPAASEAPAIAADGTILLDTYQELAALDREGNVRWRYEISPMEDPRFRPRMGVPILSETGTVYFTFHNRLLALLTPHPAAANGWTMFRGNARKAGSAERDSPSAGMTARLEPGGTLALEFFSADGAEYHLEFSEDLRIWSLLRSVSGKGTKTQLKEEIETGAQKRFYRVTQP